MPASTSLAAIDQKHLLHPLHHPSSHASARTSMSGRGAVITDDTGRQYIGGLAGLVGHGRAELAQAAFDQMSRLA